MDLTVELISVIQQNTVANTALKSSIDTQSALLREQNGKLNSLVAGTQKPQVLRRHWYENKFLFWIVTVLIAGIGVEKVFGLAIKVLEWAK